MKRSLAAAFVGVLALSACNRGEPAPDTDAAAAPSTVDPAGPAPDAAPATAAQPDLVAAGPTSPAFAPLYPGATVTQPVTVAQGPDGKPGAVVTFTTPDEPEAVIDFYRRRAEASGLTQVMALNRGEAKAYGAAKVEGGVFLNVVADPVAPGETSVQLSWTGGR